MSKDSPDNGHVRPFRWSDLEFDEAAGEQVFGEGFSGPSEAPSVEPEVVESPREQGERLLEEARTEAEALLDQARAQADEIREQARREGHEEGRKAGLEELESAAEQVRGMAEELARYKPELYQEARGQVVELVLELLHKLVGPVVEANPDVVLRVVERSLQLLTDRELLTVRVHPSELKRMVEAKPDLLEAFDGIQRLTVLEDPAVKPGGCLVQTANTEIDARLETQLQEIARLIRNP